jgi:phospholipid/cholesterol/gamma-HCH transport system ATP-binding protein
MSEPKYYLEWDGVRYERDGIGLLNNISFNVGCGEFVVVAGSDVGGKTSFLKLCIGLLQPQGGVIRVNGKPLREFSYNELQALRARTGFVFQDGVLISNLTLKENIALPLRYHSGLAGPVPNRRGRDRGVRLKSREIEKRVAKYLESLELVRYADARPAELTVELKLLTGFARALVGEPELLLLDELFVSLSRTNANRIIEHLKEVKARRPLTCLATTNTVNLVSSFPEEPLVDCLMVMESGGIIERGSPRAVRENLMRR